MITGIEALTYGVTDLGKSCSYFGDWGLRRGPKTKGRIVFRTRNGAEVILRPRGAWSPRDLSCLF